MADRYMVLWQCCTLSRYSGLLTATDVMSNPETDVCTSTRVSDQIKTTTPQQQEQ